MERWIAVLLVAMLGCGGEPAAAKEAPVAPVAREAAVPGAAAGVAGDAAGGGDAGVSVSAGAAAACPECPVCAAEAGTPHDVLTLTKAAFAELPGWAGDRHAEALGAFLRSCEAIGKLGDAAPVGHDGHGGVARQWRRACAAAAKVPAGDHEAARRMFEAELKPFAAAGKKGADGLFTGYHVQELRASRKRGGKYQHALYARPKDLVMIDLSLYIKDARGRRVWGRLDGKGEMVPYYSRQEIRKGALDGRGLELMYADDAVDVMFAHIQGSVKVRLDDGTSSWLDFAGKNGRTWRGVGGLLKRMGAFKPPATGTMQDIRAWFAANPTRFDEIADLSPSFVFFRESKTGGAVGSQMVVLTDRRSMAIDRAFIAFGTPIWLDTIAPSPGKGAGTWRRLLIAQDTGGAILGAVRGDIYFGDDATAADVAGRMGTSGRYWLLLPNGVTK